MDTAHRIRLTAVLMLVAALGGCLSRDAKLEYHGNAELQYYKDVATSLDYPTVPNAAPEQVMATTPPRTVVDREHDQIRDITITETLHLALENNPIIRTDSQFYAPGNELLMAGERVSSVYDPAIQESGVLFGGRGVEAALSDFDPQLSAAMLWGRDEQVQNNVFFGGGLNPGTTLQTDTANFESRLSKQFGYGGEFAVFHNWDYRFANVPGQLFNSVYTGTTGAAYRHPLLAGSGTRFTRIAGPIGNAFGGLTGVSQGVVIARINNDITLADFEFSVQQLLRETELLYWDLHLAYRLYDTAITARNSALESWKRVNRIIEAGGFEQIGPLDEAQARDQYFQARALSEEALSNIYEFEIRLRRLIGMPVNDGTRLRPSTEPTVARFIPVWEVALAEGLTRRVELRRQKFLIKSLELQLEAARSLVRPRLDGVANYRVNAFGDELLEQDDDDGLTTQGLNSAYESLTQGNQTGWNLGLEFQMNIGFRSAAAQVRNLELRLAKARDVLATMEMDIAHELAVAFQNLSEEYVTAVSNYNRRIASLHRLELTNRQLEAGTATIDLVLRAQASVAEAERDLYTSVIQYNQSIVEVYYRKGTLLDYDNVHLSEGGWTPEAYQDALRRAWARSHAHPNPLLCTEPLEFILPNYDGDHIVPPKLEDLQLPPLDGPAPAGEPVPVPPAPMNGAAVEPPPPVSEELRPPTPDEAAPDDPQPAVPAESPSAANPSPQLTLPPLSGGIQPVSDVRPAGGEAAPQPRRAAPPNPFFDDSEDLAPTEEDLELKPGRDLIE
jgi:outer membrane protein TolC